MMEIQIVASSSGKTLAVIPNLQASSTIQDVKREFQKTKKNVYPERQCFKLEPKGRALKDEDTLESLDLQRGGQLFFKDLGPQIGWKTVFLVEYAGPLFVYLGFYQRPSFIYGVDAASRYMAPVVHIAAYCWALHYMKRLLETLFIHRFSHSTMPIRNLFKNCSYYWGFAAYVAYYTNHPLYTSPSFGTLQIYGGLATFLVCELGNFSIHLALRNLRRPGTKERKIPVPTGNPFTWLFHVVSCPNYTYEVGSWIAFTIMTQCLPAGLFTAAGFYQMTVWALGKHRQYKKEFSNYPKERKSIVPFII